MWAARLWGAAESPARNLPSHPLSRSIVPDYERAVVAAPRTQLGEPVLRGGMGRRDVAMTPEQALPATRGSQ